MRQTLLQTIMFKTHLCFSLQDEITTVESGTPTIPPNSRWCLTSNFLTYSSVHTSAEQNSFWCSTFVFLAVLSKRWLFWWWLQTSQTHDYGLKDHGVLGQLVFWFLSSYMNSYVDLIPQEWEPRTSSTEALWFVSPAQDFSWKLCVDFTVNCEFCCEIQNSETTLTIFNHGFFLM